MHLRRYWRNFKAADDKIMYLAPRLILLTGMDLKFLRVAITPRVRIIVHSCYDSVAHLLSRSHKREEIAFYDRFFRDGDTFVDVGANIGRLSLVAASRVGTSGRVFAIEPGAKAFAALTDNVALNGLQSIVRTVRGALGRETGSRALYVRGRNDTISSLSPKAHGGEAGANVEVIRGDQLPGLEGTITFLKVDVEGAELEVLEGLGDRLRDVKFIRFEADSAFLAAFGVSVAQIMALLGRYGYGVYKLIGQRLVQIQATPDMETHEDLFAIRSADRGEFEERTGWSVAL